MCGHYRFFQGQFILIDNLCAKLDRKSLNLVLKTFSGSTNQIIVVVPLSAETKNLKVNVIDTERFNNFQF